MELLATSSPSTALCCWLGLVMCLQLLPNYTREVFTASHAMAEDMGSVLLVPSVEQGANNAHCRTPILASERKMRNKKLKQARWVER